MHRLTAHWLVRLLALMALALVAYWLARPLWISATCRIDYLNAHYRPNWGASPGELILVRPLEYSGMVASKPIFRDGRLFVATQSHATSRRDTYQWDVYRGVSSARELFSGKLYRVPATPHVEGVNETFAGYFVGDPVAELAPDVLLSNHESALVAYSASDTGQVAVVETVNRNTGRPPENAMEVRLMAALGKKSHVLEKVEWGEHYLPWSWAKCYLADAIAAVYSPHFGLTTYSLEDGSQLLQLSDEQLLRLAGRPTLEIRAFMFCMAKNTLYFGAGAATSTSTFVFKYQMTPDGRHLTPDREWRCELQDVGRPSAMDMEWLDGCLVLLTNDIVLVYSAPAALIRGE